MENPAIDRVRIDVVGAGRLELAVSVGADRPSRVTDRAANVDVHVIVVDDESGVVTAPGADDVGDPGRRGGAGDDRANRRNEEYPRHAVH